MRSHILSYSDFALNEELKLREGNPPGKHYLDRITLRLKKLEIIGAADSKGNKVSLDSSIKNDAEKFFRESLYYLADPVTSKFIKNEDVAADEIGLIRLGKTQLKLSDGRVVRPIFKCVNKVGKDGSQTTYATGTTFWISTAGPELSTIKLYNEDGESSSSKDLLISKSINHFKTNRNQFLSKIERLNKSVRYQLDDELYIRKHKILLTPASINNIIYDVTLPIDSQISDLKNNFKVLVDSNEPISIRANFDAFDDIDITKVPKQMNVTPNKVWLMEWNDTHKTWGAMPILKSTQVKRIDGNEIDILLGPKWLHWLTKKGENGPEPDPKFNRPIESQASGKTIKKGDFITLAKDVHRGNWLVNQGIVSEISTDLRSQDPSPFVKTDGWKKSWIIEGEEANKIFYAKRFIISEALSFVEYLNYFSISD